MEEIWQQGTCEEKKWDKELREKIHEKEQKEWIDRMKTKTKLRAYITLKQELKFEPYLTHDEPSTRSHDTTERRNECQTQTEIEDLRLKKENVCYVDVERLKMRNILCPRKWSL